MSVPAAIGGRRRFFFVREVRYPRGASFNLPFRVAYAE
jgi:hypothetical protein